MFVAYEIGLSQPARRLTRDHRDIFLDRIADKITSMPQSITLSTGTST